MKQKSARQLLQEEIQSYQKIGVENMLGKIGGVQSRKTERIINWAILLTALLVFLVNIVFKLFDPIYAVEFGILLISIKIVMLINSLSKMSHFNFWILHSIDYRINNITSKLEELEKESSKEKKTMGKAVLQESETS